MLKNMASQNKTKRQRPNPATSTSSDEDESKRVRSDTETFPSFLVVEPADNDRPIKYSIFAIQKILLAAVGTVRSAKKIRSGAVLIEVASKQQFTNAMKMTTWIDVPVKVSEHRSLNSSRGVIRCREFRDCEDEEVLDALRSQGVTAIKHIKSKRDGELQPTNTFILTFNTSSPPQTVKAAYLNITVDAYIPNPLRCYNCQRYGHGKGSCSRPQVCAKCGEKGHEDITCDKVPHCCNCGGDHAAFDKKCREWQRQQDISKTKAERGISFPEAAKVVDARNPVSRPAKSYAAAARTVRNAEVQTDLTWPLDSKLPMPTSQSQLRTTADAAVNTAVVKQSEHTQQTTNQSQPSGIQKPTQGSAKPSATSAKPKTIHSNRQSKAAPDAVTLYNKFGKLDNPSCPDDLAMDTSHPVSPPKSSKNNKI